MGENSKIEWCTHTLNFWIGCTEVSAECDNCYARQLAGRYGWAKWGNDETRRHTSEANRRKAFAWDKKAAIAGERHRVFVNSLSDTLDPFAPQDWRGEIVQTARNTPHLDYLILTKRPQNFTRLLSNRPANIWIGTTVGVKKSLARIKYLQAANASVRFLSIEPLLEDLGDLDLTGIHWVIVGGESGGKKRPFNADWARSIRDQCKEQNVAFFMKQIDKVQPIPNDLMIRQFPATIAAEGGDGNSE
jgi:protein gp37